VTGSHGGRNGPTLRVGVDVGGTNTDAVLLEGRRVVASAKSPTTPDVTSGIVSAVGRALGQAEPLPAQRIGAIMLGTTHFVNALLERRGLVPTAAIRLCGPSTTLVPPFCDWPEDLVAAMEGQGRLLSGGHEFDGREISALDEDGAMAAVDLAVERGARALAVTGVFSPVNTEHEDRIRSRLAARYPDLPVTLSHQIGRVGLLERENASILNACLSGIAHRTVAAIRDALASLGLDAPLYLTQNDGTLMDAGYAARFPVLSISSGPTNSMRGATVLAGVEDALVVDVGGTTTDVGVLVRGFPRTASGAVSIAEVRTNFRMPDLHSVALGGGSIVKTDPVRIGPRSVGADLVRRARVFGGDVTTATDIAVAVGRARVGSPDRVVDAFAPELVAEALAAIEARLESAVDRVKLRPDPVPVVLVGGGSVLIGDKIRGAAEVHTPEHADVANAIGAAIAQVGGEVDALFSLDGESRDEALRRATAEAVSRAVSAGADPATVEIVDIEEVPLTYLPGNAVRIRAKAVGDLDVES